MSKINFVDFTDGYCFKTVFGLWQWDYGQILRIQGLNLPSAVEVHFSLQETGGEAVRRIGITKDGVTDVVIPDFILEKETTTDYEAFAFIYLSDETSGETTHKIKLIIEARARPEGSTDSGETSFGAIMEEVRKIAKQSGATAEQAAQIEENKTNIGKLLDENVD